MELNKLLLDALYERIKNGEMTVEQAPEPYQAELQALIDKE